MDDRFKSVYQLLFDAYQTSSERPIAEGGAGMPPISASLRTVINQADEKLGLLNRHLRADAKYFLLTNFYTMVFLPLFFGNEGRVNLEELLASISSDVYDITQDATTRSSDSEISGHVLLDSASRRWPYLRTTRFRVWGDE